MYQVRDDEPKYAFLQDKQTREKNAHGKFIELVEKGSALRDQSLNINNDSGVGENPNRYKQHGFHFTADNCIACHACEAACSEKNDNPAHLAFRSVGYVEGGSYPSFMRMNISMACNHCDNPVCLKGCPTRAYTKFAEYGAVLQDPDICFGCGYCTWVCPYNAPQLDPIKGQVSKCNMCVDRLEAGLKPACVSACLGGALEFGVVENTPENRDQARLDIPGFPTTDITHPNIRFEQKKTLPREMTRTDSMPLKYHKDDKLGHYRPVVDEAKGTTRREWNLRKLRSREDPLVIFTLVSQAVIGAFMLLFGGVALGVTPLAQAAQSGVYMPLLFGMLGIEAVALFLSTMHLGKPHRFYRAFNNLRYSPVSREVAGIAVFFNALGAHWLLGLLDWDVARMGASVFGWLALIAGPVALYFMHRIYRIRARAFWNHWQVLSDFYGHMFALGALVVALSAIPVMAYQGSDYATLSRILAAVMAVGIVLKGIGYVFHARDLKAGGGEGAASYHQQVTRFGKTYWLRNALLGVSAVLAAVLASSAVAGPFALALWALAAGTLLLSAALGRALFYVLVIPTTMPGAFFWKNAGFIEHARETGLANMAQVGVVPDAH